MKPLNRFYSRLQGVFFPFVLLLLIAFHWQTVLAGSRQDQTLFKKAVPVWAEGRDKEMNLTLGFHGVFKVNSSRDLKIRITASTLYRLSLNGKFLGYGPARAAGGFFRVDEYDPGSLVHEGENILAVEVAGYNVNTYYTMDQPSFLLAEVSSGGQVLLATGRNHDFSAFQMRERLQKVERYSFQRPFTEYYRLSANSDQWQTAGEPPAGRVTLVSLPAVKLLPRNLLIPDFKVVSPVILNSRGTIKYSKPGKYKKDRSLTRISEKFKGYPENELEVLPSQLIQEISNATRDTVAGKYQGDPLTLAANEFAILDFGIDLTGFIGSKIECTTPSKVVFYFDEMLTAGDVNTKVRMQDINNQVVYELEPGSYSVESFEPYTFKYLKIIVLKGACKFRGVTLREYAGPENPLATFASSNNKLNEIFRAARQSFRQNAVDILTDCPSRERAGWLCDSYFSAIMEKDFTGRSAVAHNFYENYALAEKFDFLPEGMIPMCYPADHNDGVFIPNWSLWFILQIDDYIQRGGDPLLAEKLKPRIENLLGYFKKFENEDGLLEKLESWIFVEWSKANDFVRDVNYPTNMLYCDALEKAGKLYNNEQWKQKAAHIRQSILKQSFNGDFFIDNAVRDKKGKLQPTQNTTEVCQYYAFFFNMATPISHPELWKKLTTEFGPSRDDKTTYPMVFRANAFVGNYLRMDILSRYGRQSQVLKEIQDYFYGMARLTGTLWENMDSHASCNHGFASYLGHVLYRDILGISRVDYLKKEIVIQFTDIELDECRGSIPLGDGTFDLEWKRSGNQIRYRVKNDTGYVLRVVNLGSSVPVQL
jgi:alpha-L-rhamnosidase